MEALVKYFIKDYKNVKSPTVRKAYGNLTSIIGILVNILLFAAKFVIGTLFSSVSIVGDAVNNLSDAGSCLISLVSFKLSSKPDDKKHPFGHARIEYLSSLLVAGIIIYLSITLFKESFQKMLNPGLPEVSILMISVLILSILAKLYLYMINKNFGNRISSKVMLATAADSLSDVIATGAVLLSMIISPLIHYSLDGIMGIIVSIIIFKSGYEIVKDSLDVLLGGTPSEETVKLISDFVKSYDCILGIHDLLVHDYGPSKLFASVHAEVNASMNFIDCHDIIDNIEKDIYEKHGIKLVIHMDPIVVDDKLTNNIRKKLKEMIKDIDDSLSCHDFRMVVGDTHTNLIFDVVVPYDYEHDFDYLNDEINKRISAVSDIYRTVITFERDMCLQK